MLYKGRFNSASNWVAHNNLVPGEPLLTAGNGAYALPGSNVFTYNEMGDDYIASGSQYTPIYAAKYIRQQKLVYDSGIGTPRYDSPLYKQFPASITTPTNSARFVDNTRGNVY